MRAKSLSAEMRATAALLLLYCCFTALIAIKTQKDETRFACPDLVAG
jgi:hypothetical protein